MKRTDSFIPLLNHVKPFWWLLVGVVTMAASHTTFSIDLVGWIAYVPFLIYLRITTGWKSRLWFMLALVVAWSLVVLKILSPPMPLVMIFLFSIPISLFHLPAYLIWDRFKSYKWSVILFPSIMTVMEWIQYTFTPFASWGAAAYTQSHSLNIMQSLSLFGLPGLSFLIYWVNSSIAQTNSGEKRTFISLQISLLVLLLFIGYGSLRLDIEKSKGRDTMTVAAVGVGNAVGVTPESSGELNDSMISDLFTRTGRAARAGASLVVWNEGSFYILPENETTLKDNISSLAKEEGISLVAAYVVPVSEKPLTYENKYLFVNQDGEIENTYLKHQPVPGEPAIKGTNPLTIVNLSGIRVGGVICYDYDFPYLAQEFGKLDADIVAVPSSDWRGIDPLHTRMAAFRAVEQGHSIIRSTRFGCSAAITPWGEMIAQMSSFDHNNKIMIADIPTHRIRTVYSITGNVVIYLSVAFIILFFIQVLRKRWVQPDRNRTE